MQYKSLRFFVSLITSIILLGHTLVPHHHADAHSHGHRHNHEHNHENRGIKDLFAHHCHSVDYFTSVQKHEASKPVGHAAPAIATSQYSFNPAKAIYKPVKYEYKSSYIYISPHLVNLDFRGPPMPII